MRVFRSKHPKNVFLVHLNVDFLRNKFEPVNKLIIDTFAIFLVSEGNESSFRN